VTCSGASHWPRERGNIMNNFQHIVSHISRLPSCDHRVMQSSDDHQRGKTCRPSWGDEYMEWVWARAARREYFINKLYGRQRCTVVPTVFERVITVKTERTRRLVHIIYYNNTIYMKVWRNINISRNRIIPYSYKMWYYTQ